MSYRKGRGNLVEREGRLWYGEGWGVRVAGIVWKGTKNVGRSCVELIVPSEYNDYKLPMLHLYLAPITSSPPPRPLSSPAPPPTRHAEKGVGVAVCVCVCVGGGGVQWASRPSFEWGGMVVSNVWP